MKTAGIIMLAALLFPLPIKSAEATSFDPAVTTDLSTESNAPSAAVFADFNRDGAMDLAVALSDGSNHNIRIMTGNGSGSLGSPVDLQALSTTRGIVAADLNSDGITDLAVSNSGDNSISLYLGNGDGTFQTRADYPVGTAPKGIAVGDFRGDGTRDDIAVVNGTDNSVAILLNDGAGAMTAQGSGSWPTAPAALSGIAVGDFNGDGIDDIAVARSGAAAVSVLNGRGDATFSAAESFATGAGPSALAYGDLNGSGNELLSTSITGQSYSLLFNTSDPVAGLDVTPRSHDFGTIQVDDVHNLYLSKQLAVANGGSAPLAISSMVIGGTNRGDFQVTTQDGATCPTTTPTLVPGSSCTVLMKFLNPITEGARSATLTIAGNAPLSPSLTIPLSGTGVTAATPYTVHLSFLGMGSGAVTFSTGEAGCAGTCDRAALTRGVMELTPAPGSGSLIHGWTGCDTVQYGICSIDMGINNGRDRDVTVTFGLVPRRVLLSSGRNVYLATVGNGYESATSGEQIKVAAGYFAEDLNLNRNIDTMLKGGYGSGFATQEGTTVLRSMTIASGSATVENIVLQ